MLLYKKLLLRTFGTTLVDRYLVLSAQPILLRGISDDSRAANKGDEVPLGSI